MYAARQTNGVRYPFSSAADGNVASLPSDSVGLTFDALDRMVEQNLNGSYTQIVYGPNGGKLALMNVQTLNKAFVPLPGGATAVYNSSGLLYYRHSDWLGSSRFASYGAGGSQPYYDGAYAPYGENYAEMGTQDRNFTGQNQDTINSGPYPLYDFLSREYHPVHGRWPSPDPAGLAAANLSNPQSLNRYAYALNNPLTLTDPLGLDSGATQKCSPGQHPPRPDLWCGPDSHWHESPCTDMDCADQYYGGEMFYGDITVMEPICLIGGVLGYCGEGLFASYRSPTGADVFDVLNPASGVYWTAPPGSAVTNSSGRTSTSTGNLGFSDQVWTWARDTEDFPAINALSTGQLDPRRFTGPDAQAKYDQAWDAAMQQLGDITSGDYSYFTNFTAASQSPNAVPFGLSPVYFKWLNPPEWVLQWTPLPGFGQ
jgi:RHS repeat-associated protein